MKIYIRTNNAIPSLCAVESVRHRQNVDVQAKFKEVCVDQTFNNKKSIEPNQNCVLCIYRLSFE